MRYRDGRRSLCLSVPVRLSAHMHVLRHGADALRAEPHARRRSSTRRSTSAASSRSTTASSWAWASRCSTSTTSSAPRARLPGPRHHAPANDGLDRRLAARPQRFVDEVEEPIRLALSLHAADDALRSRLMPVNDRYPLADVLAECRRYVDAAPAQGFRRVRDARRRQRPRRAGAAARVAPRLPSSFKVNLIPYNPTGAFDGSSRKAIDAFKGVLDRAGVPATVRLTRGRDIDAACGQLAAKRVAA